MKAFVRLNVTGEFLNRTVVKRKANALVKEPAGTPRQILHEAGISVEQLLKHR